MTFTLDGTTPSLLPKSVAKAVMAKATEASVISQLGAPDPITIGDTVIPVYEGGIEAGVVGEGEPAGVSNVQAGGKVLRPIGLETIVLVSKESARLNPGGMLDLIEADLAAAITRALDLGVMHGRSAKTGAAIADAVSVGQTTNRAVFAPADPLGPQILAAYALAAEDHDPNGIAADSRFRVALNSATDQNSKSVFSASAPDLSRPLDVVWGLPTAYGRAVAGRVGASVDTKTKLIVGDWSKVRWGYAEAISIERSTEATVVDGGTTYHAFQQGLIALKVTAKVAWTVLDLDAFAVLETV